MAFRLKAGLIRIFLPLALPVVALVYPGGDATAKIVNLKCIQDVFRRNEVSQRRIGAAKEILTQQSLAQDYRRGTALFADESGTRIARPVGEIKSPETPRNNLLTIATTPKGRRFVIKERPSHEVKKEFRILKALKAAGVPTPQVEIVRLAPTSSKSSARTFLAIEEVPGINIKDLILRMNQSGAIQKKIEKMLGKPFQTPSEAIDVLKRILLKDPNFKPQLRKIESQIRALRFVPNDFQFMFQYNPKTKKISIVLIDVEEFAYEFVDPKPWQDLDQLLRALDR